jgi:exodeoxyribonuclease V alpha subunit
MSDTIEGAIERITYHNEENGYTIARLTDRRGALHTLVGNLIGISVGESLRVAGEWITHPQYGRQLKVERYETILPATVEGIRKYLGSGLIKGVGPVTARRIVKRFGVDTLRIIDEEPDRLREALGVGAQRARMIKDAWQEQKRIKDLMIFLQDHEVSVSLAVKIYRQYGDDAIDIVRNDPYRLAQDIYGIGFITADRIARKLGLPADSPRRVQAGIAYVLGQKANEGHVYTPQSELVATSTEMLVVNPTLVHDAVEVLEGEQTVRREGIYYPTSAKRPAGALQEEQAVYLAPFYHSEVGVARLLQNLSHVSQPRLPLTQPVGSSLPVNSSAPVDDFRLSPAQQAAVKAALTHKVVVLTGGPGTGKTTTIRTILRLLDARGSRTLLAAPTGRAAKRLTELTGREAKTIHRLLEFSPQAGFQFQRNEENPLNADMVIVDEASMLDLLLTYHLLQAIPPSARLLLVGDVDQLPSVGAGNVLRDLIDSGEVAVVRLETIFRQASDSWIVENAHRIHRGEMPLFPPDARDFFLFPTEEPEQAAELVVDIVANRIPRKFGFDPRDDVQVLCPMHRGSAGVANLNDHIQAALNPADDKKAERRVGGALFREGDRVMQIRNNYDKEVFNGDIGVVTRIDPEDHIVLVMMDDRPVSYEFNELDDLTLAYAISIHKSQGSEYPAVVIPLLTQHYMMLQRNLLYTAVTRAQKLVVIVGSRRAIGMAVKNNRTVDRYTGLQERLRSAPLGERSRG